MLETVDKVDGAVDLAVRKIRALILRRQLTPGEQVRQESLAATLGISRGPIREALKILSEEAIVEYIRNRGYFVARFSKAEMEQMYMLRDLVESAILERMRSPKPGELAALKATNDQMRDKDLGLEQFMTLNDQFHTGLLGLSDLNVAVAEALRLWRMSLAYRTLSVSALADRQVITTEHGQKLKALKQNDTKALTLLAREHREVSLQRLLHLLP